MSTLEAIGVVAFLVFIACVILSVIWSLLTWSYFNHIFHKKANKLQWKCDETWSSRERRKNGESGIYECSVSYRVLPSELNAFVRIFGNNEWNYPFETHQKFKCENDFKEFVKDWKTYGDFQKWLDKKNGTLWYEPEN